MQVRSCRVSPAPAIEAEIATSDADVRSSDSPTCAVCSNQQYMCATVYLFAHLQFTLIHDSFCQLVTAWWHLLFAMHLPYTCEASICTELCCSAPYTADI
jgi:hypothetical protein